MICETLDIPAKYVVGFWTKHHTYQTSFSFTSVACPVLRSNFRSSWPKKICRTQICEHLPCSHEQCANLGPIKFIQTNPYLFPHPSDVVSVKLSSQCLWSYQPVIPKGFVRCEWKNLLARLCKAVMPHVKDYTDSQATLPRIDWQPSIKANHTSSMQCLISFGLYYIIVVDRQRLWINWCQL